MLGSRSRVKDWIPDVPRDMSWLFSVAGVKQAVKEKVEDKKRWERKETLSSSTLC